MTTTATTRADDLRADVDAATEASQAAHDAMITARADVDAALTALGDAQVTGQDPTPLLERVTLARDALTLAETAASAWERHRRHLTGYLPPAGPEQDGRTVTVHVFGPEGKHVANTSNGRKLHGGERLAIDAADALSLVPSYAEIDGPLPSWWPSGKSAYVTTSPKARVLS